MVATVLPDMEVAPDVGPDVPQAKPRKGGKKFMLAGEERMKRIQKQLKERRTKNERKCGVPKLTFANMRDKPITVLLLLTFLFVVSVCIVSYTAFGPPAPYACDSCSSTTTDVYTGKTASTPCSHDHYFSSLEVGTLRQRDTCIRNSEGQSYFVVDVQANKNANKPDDCWATWDSNTSQWVDSKQLYGIRTQNRNSTWHAEDHCLLKYKPYTSVVRSGLWWQLALVAIAPLVINLAGVAVLAWAPGMLFDATFAACIVSFLAGVGIAAWRRSYFGFLWGGGAVVVGITFAVARSAAKLNVEMVLTTAARVVSLDTEPMVGSVSLVALVSYGGLFCWLFVFMRLAGRLTAIVDVVFFLGSLWIVTYLKNTLCVAGAQAAGVWYYRYVDVPQPFLQGLRRALTLNAGSLALGAAFSSASKALQVTAGFLRTRVTARMQILAALATALDFLLRPFNTFGFVYVVFHNSKYTHACLDALLLLTGTNVRLISADGTMALLQVAGGLLSGMAGIGVAYLMTHFYFASTPLDDRALYYVYMYAPAFLFPFVVGFLPANALEGGVLAIYLAFADDPLVLESTEPNLYMDMLDAWQVAMEDVQMAADEMRPEDLEAGSEDNMSKSSDGERSELDETEVQQLPNERMRKWRRKLTVNPTAGNSMSLFAQDKSLKKKDEESVSVPSRSKRQSRASQFRTSQFKMRSTENSDEEMV